MENTSCSEAVLVDNVVPLCVESGTQHLLVQHEGFRHDGFLSLLHQCTHLLKFLTGFIFSGINRVCEDHIILRNGAGKKGLERIPIHLRALVRQYIVMLFLIPQKFFHISE